MRVDDSPISTRAKPSVWFTLFVCLQLIAIDSVVICVVRKDFNRALWHCLLILFPLCLLVWWFLTLLIKGRERADYFVFDPKHSQSEILKKENGDFGQHSQQYRDLAKLLITLSTGIIAFLMNVLANAKEPLSANLREIESCAPIIVGFFCFAAGSLIFFMTIQTIFYEEYCHAPEHNTYVRGKYLLCNLLAYAGLGAFIVGIGWLAGSIF